MGYYCTVPQCTSLAGKTKNVKFHRFPRDIIMANKWNIILKRGKPYTKYSKVCSLHFTQADYNISTMGKILRDKTKQYLAKALTKLHINDLKNYKEITFIITLKRTSPLIITLENSLTIIYKQASEITRTCEDVSDSRRESRAEGLLGRRPGNSRHSGQWKTLNKDAVPSQNLPKLNPDGTVMVIRKSRTVKYKEQKKEDIIADKTDKWLPLTGHPGLPMSMSPDRTLPAATELQDGALTYRLQKLNDLANIISPQQSNHSMSPPQTQLQPQSKPKKQDAIMQTDPIVDEDDQNTNYESSEKSYSPDQAEQYQSRERYEDQEQYKHPQEQYKEPEQEHYAQKEFEMAKDYTKPTDDYIPQTNEEYNKEAEKYALERKSHNGYEKGMEFQKHLALESGYGKLQDMYPLGDKQPEYEVRADGYVFQAAAAYPDSADSADSLRSQQHNLQMLQEQHRINENQNFFDESHIKQEIDFGNEEDKFLYERNKEQIEPNLIYESQRRLLEQQRLLEQLQHQVKQEPDVPNGCENVMQPQTSPYYNTNGHTNVTGGYYEQISRPGPELLIAKQNALAAHTQLWQNTMKRPFFYSETSHYNSPQLLHRYEDLTRIQQ